MDHDDRIKRLEERVDELKKVADETVEFLEQVTRTLNNTQGVARFNPAAWGNKLRELKNRLSKL